jgi:hypothetical protein
VVGVVVADHDVGDVGGGDAEPLQRLQERLAGRDHAGVDDDDPVAVADERDGAGHAERVVGAGPT